jgi:hypothetical protein
LCEDQKGAANQRRFDLKRAYRQCAIHPGHARYSYIAVAHAQEKQVKCFRMKALPFGSVMSVHSFLRISHSLWTILVSIFGVFISNYFDDFVALATSCETKSVTTAVTLTFKMLGWIFAETGDKAPPFASVVAALGVTIDVSLFHSGCVKIDNTETRKAEIAAAIRHILDTGTLLRPEALRLRGRLQFVAGQIFGRIAKRSLAIITKHAYGESGPTISTEAPHALQLFHQLILMDVPREVSLKAGRTWYIFTDACYEPQDERGSAGIGAVLVDQLGNYKGFFSMFLTEDLLTKLNITKRKTIIFECELLAIFVAMTCWSKHLQDSQVVVCTDNEGVKDSLIACQTSSYNATPILVALLQLEFDLRWNAWFSRVPSESNIADEPSRGETQQLLAKGVQQFQIDLDSMWNGLLELATRGGFDQHSMPHAVKKV